MFVDDMGMDFGTPTAAGGVFIDDSSTEFETTELYDLSVDDDVKELMNRVCVD